ncbi:MAG: DUF433 domain-containing protein [Phyllobacteriaceae bacterium]|nr:DUF433 domain-containing protein [Phyllobacteriaceae bacterium]
MIHEKIVSDPSIMSGKPVVRGTRITVELILRKLGHGATVEQLLEDYPAVSRDDVMAAQAFAADYLAGEKIEAAE